MSHNSIAAKFSGTVINQNRVVANPADYASGTSGAWCQEFFLPADYRRGTESDELHYPDLSGFQLLVQITPGYAAQAAFEYEVQYQIFGLGWITATSGVAIGAPSDGKTWMTAYFADPVEIDQTKAEARWRINFEGRAAVGQPKDVPVAYADGAANVYGNRIPADLVEYEPYPFDFQGTPAFLYSDAANAQVLFSYQQGIEKFWFASPNPLALPTHVKASTQAGVPLSGSSGEASFCFRVLAMVADDGTDFLGNQYRAVVTRNRAANISTAFGADPDSYWLSKPNPSKFAVENLYFDIRRAGSTTCGDTNMVLNPIPFSATGFASDGTFYVNTVEGALGHGFITDTDGAGAYRFQSDASPGQQGVRVTSLSSMTFKQGVKYWFTLKARASAAGNATMFFGAGATEPGVNSTTVALTTSYQTFAVSWTPSADRTGVSFGLKSPDAGAANTYYMRNLMVAPGSTQPAYLDGSMDGHIWSAAPNASASYELIPPSADDISSVIDRMLIDPITPGAYFSVYFTDEGEPGTDDATWEQKLWTRVPQTYRMERRETHVFPEPIKAKYIKVEFSHLQAKHYAPGAFQRPIRYKKHPKWVLDYFLARLQTDQSNPFLAERVAVIYDAIDLAYNYYLDDLGQEPSTTVDVNVTSRQQVVNFLSDRSDVSDRIDLTTLDKIDLTLDSFRQHPALRGQPGSLLADYARSTVDYTVDYPTETRPPAAIDNADVSSLNRDRVVLEQNMPVMFFYLVCRHGYREVEAKLSHDRAYFVGVRELAFLRDNYMTAFDTTTYIEPASDTENIARNEFV